MNRLVTFVLLFAALSWAQAPRRQKPPVRPDATATQGAGLDIATERHHKLALENEKVRVFAVELPGQAATALVRHEHDFLMLALTDAQIEIAPERGSAQRLRMSAGELQLGTQGLVNRVVNKAGAPIRYLIIEILPGIEPRLAICGLGGRPCESDLGDLRGPNATTSGLFETPTVRVSRIELDPAAVLPEQQHKYDLLEVALTDLDLRSEMPDKGGNEIRQASGEVAWQAGGFAGSLANAGKEQARLLSIEIK